MHTMTSLCKATGVNASTIRTWERRYGVPRPTRLENGRRRYSDEDVQKIQLFAALLDRGAQIGEIVTLPVDVLEQRLNSMVSAVDYQSQSEFALLKRLKEATKAKNFSNVRRDLGLAISMHPPVICVEAVLAPFMRWVGDEWHKGRVSVAVEHSVTALVRQLVSAAAASQSWDAGGPLFIFGTPQNELHELGALFAWYIASASGLNAIYLGANLPISDLSDTLRQFGAQTFVLSVVQPSASEDPLKGIAKFSVSGPLDETEIWIGCSPEMNSRFANHAAVKIFNDYSSYERSLKLRNQLLMNDS